MKTTMTVLAAAGLVAAQQIPEIPSCAIECLSQGLPELGCSDFTDFECLCSSLADIMEQQAGCFTDSCRADELMNAQEAALDLCNNILSTSLSVPSMTATSGTSTAAETTVTNTVTTPSTSGMETPSPSSSGMATETDTATTTATETDGSETGSATESGDGAEETGDGENAAGKPIVGLAAAALALAAAL